MTNYALHKGWEYVSHFESTTKVFDTAHSTIHSTEGMGTFYSATIITSSPLVEVKLDLDDVTIAKGSAYTLNSRKQNTLGFNPFVFMYGESLSTTSTTTAYGISFNYESGRDFNQSLKLSFSAVARSFHAYELRYEYIKITNPQDFIASAPAVSVNQPRTAGIRLKS